MYHEHVHREHASNVLRRTRRFAGLKETLKSANTPEVTSSGRRWDEEQLQVIAISLSYYKILIDVLTASLARSPPSVVPTHSYLTHNDPFAGLSKCRGIEK